MSVLFQFATITNKLRERKNTFMFIEGKIKTTTKTAPKC